MKSFVERISGRLERRKFLSNVLLLAGGTAVGQGLLVLASPVLTRLYSPAEFGVFAVFVSLLTLLLPLASMRYEVAIPLPAEEGRAANLLVLSLLILAGMVVATAAAFFCAGEALTVWIRAPQVRVFLSLLPLALLGAGVCQVYGAWSSRCKEFGLLSYTRGLQSAGQVIIQLASGFLKLGAIGLLSGYIVSQFLGLGSLARRAHIPWSSVSVRNCKRAAHDFREFFYYNTWALVLTIIGLQAPVILFAKYFSIDDSGYFSLAFRVLGMPATVIGAAVAQVFYPTIAEEKTRGVPTRKALEGTSLTLLALSFALFAFIGLHGPELFGWIFGSKWRVAGEFARYLAPSLMSAFVISPVSTVPLVEGAQKQGFGFSVAVTFFRIGSILCGVQLASIGLAIGLFSATATVINVLFFAWVLRLSGSSLTHWLRVVAGPLGIGVVLVAVLLGLRLILPIVASTVLSAAALGMYTLWFWRFLERINVHD